MFFGGKKTILEIKSWEFFFFVTAFSETNQFFYFLAGLVLILNPKVIIDNVRLTFGWKCRVSLESQS